MNELSRALLLPLAWMMAASAWAEGAIDVPASTSADASSADLQDTGRDDVMQLALAGKPALAALRLAVDLSESATCRDLGVLNDLMLASDSHGWLLEVVGEETLKAKQKCLAPPVLLAWAREKLRALDPTELPKPEEMLHGDSDRVEFVYEDEAPVLFEFAEDVPSSPPGPRQSGVSFETGPAADEKEVEFEFEPGTGTPDLETLSSGEIAVHFNATLTEPFQGPAEAERLYLWGSFDYLRAENENSKQWFERLLVYGRDSEDRHALNRAEVGLARLAFDAQRFSESFERFDRVAVRGDTIDTRWLPELVWSAYFAGRDDFLNRLFEWISADRIHPLALGDSLGLVPRILEEQCRRADALKVTSYLIDSMRLPPLDHGQSYWGPYRTLVNELQQPDQAWLEENPYAPMTGWLKARATRYRQSAKIRQSASLKQALAQLLRTRIDMRLGRGLMRCRL